MGANLPLSLLVASIPFFVFMVCYIAIGAMMPRSASDYVWVSRVFHPAVGFTWSLIYMFAVFYVAYVGEVFSFSYAFSTTGAGNNIPLPIAHGPRKLSWRKPRITLPRGIIHGAIRTVLGGGRKTHQAATIRELGFHFA